MDSYNKKKNVHSENEYVHLPINVKKKNHIDHCSTAYPMQSIAYNKPVILDKDYDISKESDMYIEHRYADDKSNSCDLSRESSEVLCVCDAQFGTVLSK